MRTGLGVVCGALAALCAVVGPAAAQTRLFEDRSELSFVIEGPIAALVRAAPRSTDPYPAILAFAGDARRFELEISARGLSRRTGGICSFPPIRLDFDGDALRGSVLQGQNRLKLVTRCRAGARYEQVTVLEYTAYRLYNELTPLSFRVRPARVTYRDIGGRRREEVQFNFLVEDVDEVARRSRRVALEVERGEVRPDQLDADVAASVALFQFMIGNLDWDMVSALPGAECCHNGKLLAATAGSRENVVPVPYDFDHSGFVNAPYATPPDGLGISNVRTRVYRGFCVHNARLPAAAERFRARRAALLAIIDGETRLTQGRRRSAREYIEAFYDIIGDPRRMTRQIVERCRG